MKIYSSKLNIVVLAILFFGIFGLAGSSEAANWYVRPSGGSGLGTSWTTAWNGLGNINWLSINAGDTIWIAGGSYGSLGVQRSGNSSQRLYIKRARATNTECTAAGGWQSGFDSQVIISGGISFNIHGLEYVTIDGQVTNGIKVNYYNEGRGVNISKKADHVQLFNLELVGPAGNSTSGYPETRSTRGILVYCWENWGTGVYHVEPVYNLHVKNCNIHGSSTLIYIHTAHNTIVEGCNLFDSRYDPSVAGPAAVHANVMYSQGSNNGIFRNNKVWNMEAEGVFFNYSGQTGWKFYGNLFRDSVSYGRAIETKEIYTHGTFEAYNNTIVNMWGGIRFFGVSSGTVKNNLFYNVTSHILASHDYNASDVDLGEAHGQIITSSIFVNYAGKNFQLTSSTSAGDSAIGAEYNTDMLGTTRATDGTWDKGAYEFRFSGSYTPRPSAPSNLSID